MSAAVFGPGVIIVTRTDTAIPVAFNIGYANEFSLDISAPTKQLMGQNQFPIAVARGVAKVTGKAKAAVLSGQVFNAAFFGQSFTAGKDNYYFNEPHTPSTTTQVVTNTTGGIVDLGVTYAATGIPLVRVATASVAGTYSVVQSTGTYTFVAADEVALNFNYSNFSSASGQQLNITNQLIGVTPTFQLDYWTNLNQPAAKPFAVRLFSCAGSKLQIASKIEDFVLPELDFEVFANAAGQVMNINFPDLG
ncbi:hypothetical protein DFR50_14256 [Roseiarcus fermentans]|uniref:Tail tube protein n=1 Tax=Roseiarcus fermentans TaxID=1473586 RepID=A0A366EN36_9HYPH|nr:hypothetical protein [Roseiarcus fermentans]RBP03808.1 hypothetical protein DFR50_14256 [Roseiarcus fermentans]